MLSALEDDRTLFSQLIGSPVPQGWPQCPEAIGFALEQLQTAHEVDHVVAHTLPGPNPSTGVLVSLGFGHVADQADPEVGTVWEWRWSRPAATDTSRRPAG